MYVRLWIFTKKKFGYRILEKRRVNITSFTDSVFTLMRRIYFPRRERALRNFLLSLPWKSIHGVKAKWFPVIDIENVKNWSNIKKDTWYTSDKITSRYIIILTELLVNYESWTWEKECKVLFEYVQHRTK